LAIRRQYFSPAPSARMQTVKWLILKESFGQNS
jgi:hypothetical protein